MKLSRPEFLCVGAAFSTALVSFTWFGFFAQKPTDPQSIREHPAGVPAAYQRTNYNASLPIVAHWPPPSAQSRGNEWIYDVFTPPEIFYDSRLASFTVTPPVTLLAENQSKPPDGDRFAGLHVVEVKQTPFRLQLIGYLKTSNECMGLFENRVTGAVLLASKSRTLPELGLVIESIGVRRDEIIGSGNPAGSQLVAVASIRDVVTNELITLSTAARCFAPNARATLVGFNPEPSEREVGEGDAWEIEGVTYEVDEIQVSPAAVVIKRRSGGANDDEWITLSFSNAKSPAIAVPSL